MKEKIASLLGKHVKLDKQEILNLIEVPKDSNLGDYAFPCFVLAKEHKKSPVEIAKHLAEKISSKEFEKIVAAGPYVNFFVNRNNLVKSVIDEIQKRKDKYGSSTIGKGKKVVIDFSGPNVGKPMHVGHIRSTIVGDSVRRIYDSLGYKTIGINYLGDIGLHIGKLIIAYELWLDKKALKEDPIKEMLRLYVKFSEKEKLEFQEGQEEDYEGNEWTKKAKEKVKLLESGDKKTNKLWKEIIADSKLGFDRVYKLLDVKFDETTGQSNFSDKGKELVNKASKEKIATLEPETWAVYVEFDNLPKRYVLRSNGTASYITQDIGAAVERNKKYKFDEMIYVTDYRQILHFQQLFEILNKFGFDFYKKCKHLPFGTINFGTEIMATREGKVILLEDVLQKAIQKADEEIKKRESLGDSQKIGISAVKYIILKNEPAKDVSFSWDQVLSFEGNTGPYLLYTFVRANSILKKANYKPGKKYSLYFLDDKEKNLLSQLGNFPKEVLHAHDNLAPNIIANYAYQLCQTFNEFYHSKQVIGAEDEQFRLVLVDSFSQVLKNALSLLGIKTLEKM